MIVNRVFQSVFHVVILHDRDINRLKPRKPAASKGLVGNARLGLVFAGELRLRRERRRRFHREGEEDYWIIRYETLTFSVRDWFDGFMGGENSSPQTMSQEPKADWA